MFSNGNSARLPAASVRRRSPSLRKLGLAALVALTALAATPAAYGRGGQAADDCPPGNKDPDCSTH